MFTTPSRVAALLLVAPGLAAATDLPRLETQLATLTRPGNQVGFSPRSAAGRRGLEHVLDGRSLPFTIPDFLFGALSAPATPAERWLEEGLAPNPYRQVDGEHVSIGEGVRTDDLGFTLVTRGCLTCHAAPLEGKLVAGLPNAHLDLVGPTDTARRLRDWDFFRALEAPNALAMVAKTTGQEAGAMTQSRLRRLYRYVRDYKAYADEVLVPSYTHSKGRGDNTANYGAWFMSAKMVDPAGKGIAQRQKGDAATAEDEALLATLALPTVDPAPWWNIRFKARAYRFWDAPGHDPASFNFNFFIPERHVDGGATPEEHKAKLARRLTVVADSLQFARETVPPPLPPAQQDELRSRWDEVAEGERIFHGGRTASGSRQRCASCHGSYRTEGAKLVVGYPNRGRMDVGTDDAYNRVLQHVRPLAEKINETREFFGDETYPPAIPVDGPGYVPPVLVGVWASAPYFHNGAVPTLEAVLTRPEERPEIWERTVDRPGAIDFEAGGLLVRHLDREALATLDQAADGKGTRAPEALARRRVYDTREYGRSRLGHPFGTRLAPEEKRAILAFLRALAPLPERPDIEPASD